MATEWMPVTRFEPRSWLLANGEVIKEPAMEQTATGRKIRVVGTKTSLYASELDRLLWESAKEVAKAKNTTVLMEVLSPTAQANAEESVLGFATAQHTSAKLHTVHDPTTSGASTVLWWRFKKPNAPFEAILSVQLMNYQTHQVPSRQLLQVHLSFPIINPTYGTDQQIAVASSAYQEFVSVLDGDELYAWREFFRDNRPNWNDSYLTTNTYINTHYKAIEKVLEIVRHIEELDTIQVPNVASLGSPEWMELELYDTNVNAEVISDLAEWLDANPLVEGILNAYQNLLDQLSRSGFSVNEKSGNDFLSALLSGDTASMGMAVMNSLNHDGDVDRWHTVSVHLPTGTFMVECSHATMDRAAISEQWEEALTIARLSGEEDVLLEYARAAANKEATKRAKKVIKDRQ